MDKKNKDSSFGRLLALLLVVAIVGLSLYWLPETLLGYKIKKVDLLSDIRIKSNSSVLASLKKQIEEDTVQIGLIMPDDSLLLSIGYDSMMLASRDSLYRILHATKVADSTGSRIEDYSFGHIGLKRFFSALNRRSSLDRPVRIAFLGDSFIEGDIVVADFRSAMQAQFGGRGVGFVPVSSVTDQFRPTIDQQSEGWTSFSIMTDTIQDYTLSGMLFYPSERASLALKTVDRYPGLNEVSSIKLLYSHNKETSVHFTGNAYPDTLIKTLPQTSTIAQYELKGPFTKGRFTFTNTDSFQVLGTVLEDNNGIVVDNFSLRGNTGMLLSELDVKQCRAFSKIRPYDLIVLQYGLNVVSENILNYGWYRARMVSTIKHLQECFPDTDILLLGVSDMGYQAERTIKTMPAVLALLHAQRQTAQQAGITFWNTFGAMGGENSMRHYVERNWASKDYTHLSFRGGREVANALVKSLLLEKEFYDVAEE